MKNLMEKARHVQIPQENPVSPEVLRARVRVQVFPLGIHRINGRIYRTGTNMAKPTAHTDAIGTDQILIVVIARIAIESFGVPFFRCYFIEIRIREDPQTDDAAGIAIVGSYRQVFAARADFYALIFLFVFKWIRRTIFAALVQPQTETVRTRRLGFFKAWFVDHAEVLPASVAA